MNMIWAITAPPAEGWWEVHTADARAYCLVYIDVFLAVGFERIDSHLFSFIKY